MSGAESDAPPEAALGVAAVARRLGVATGTLRTWDRRYGVGPSEHQAGSRRRYTARDLARLEVMRALMLDGATPADAARAALRTAAEEPAALASVLAPSPRIRRSRPGGGRVVPLRDASPAARGLARAAMSLDSDTCTALLVHEVRRHGVVATWEGLVQPVLTGIGERWRVTGSGVEVEHLFSESVEQALRTGVRAKATVSVRRPVLLAALEPEHHRLPLVALAAALAERGIVHRLLGAGLPERGLAAALTRTGPAAVFLWSQGARGPRAVPGPEVLAAVRPKPAVVLGGPGYQDDGWRPGVRVVGSLGHAADTLADLAVPTGARRGTQPSGR